MQLTQRTWCVFRKCALWVNSWNGEFWICVHFYICSCVDELLCTKSSSGKTKRRFSWFLSLCRTWGGWSWSRWLLPEVVAIFEHHLGLGVRIALVEKGCFGKRGKVFPGINSNSCCYCYLGFVFLLASDGPALVNCSQSHLMLWCGEAMWFMAHNCQTEQFIKLKSVGSSLFPFNSV